MRLQEWTRSISPARMLACGAAAGTLSAAVLAWRGRAETGSRVAPLNAVSHWLWGREAIRRNDTTLDHTGLGTAIHYLSALFWGVGYEALRAARRDPTPVNAVTDAAAVTSLAALVDLKVVPERLTPGFERRLSNGSLALVYLAFGVGLAVAEMSLAPQRRR